MAGSWTVVGSPKHAEKILIQVISAIGPSWPAVHCTEVADPAGCEDVPVDGGGEAPLLLLGVHAVEDAVPLAHEQPAPVKAVDCRPLQRGPAAGANVYNKHFSVIFAVAVSCVPGGRTPVPVLLLLAGDLLLHVEAGEWVCQLGPGQ